MYENNGSLSAADVAAVTGNRGFGGFGGYGDGGMFWILILFLFAFMGNGWGNGWGGNADGGGAVPYVQRGFDQQAVMSGINGLTTAVSNGFANAEVAACNRAMNTQNVLNNGFNQLALAGVQGFNGVNSGISDLKYTVATENCADRQAISDGLRDVIANNTANTNAIINNQNQNAQKVFDKLCQLELDGYKQRLEAAQAQIGQLQTQLNIADRERSQTAQTAQLIAAGQAQAQSVISSCCPKPIPAYTVPNPNCGCGTCG